MGEIMRKALIILIVVFSVFLTIGCTENKSESSTSITNKTVNETPITEITPATVTLTEEMATENQNGTKIQNTKLMQNATQKQEVTNTSTIKEFTLEELAQYDGKNGKAYVAYQGKVYDVSSSSLWKNGVHHGHSAGKDLTNEMSNSPHGSRVLNDFLVVGTLKQ
jgi:predicted heme/steroid binding protein